MIPDKINICGLSHTIKLVEDSFDLDTHFGQISYASNEIVINKNMPEQMQMLTLCHEWLHGAMTILGFHEQNEEAFVTAMANAIYQTFIPK